MLYKSIPGTFPYTYPASSSATKYEVVGQDSLYFNGGYPVSGVGGNSTIAPPSGGRFSFKGDTLFIVSTFAQTVPTETQGGATISGSAAGTATIAMVKQ